MTDRMEAVLELSEHMAGLVSRLLDVYPDDIVQQAFMLAAAYSMANRWQELVPTMADHQKAEAVRALMECFNNDAMKTAFRLGVPTGKYSGETDEIVPYNPEGN